MIAVLSDWFDQVGITVVMLTGGFILLGRVRV